MKRFLLPALFISLLPLSALAEKEITTVAAPAMAVAPANLPGDAPSTTRKWDYVPSESSIIFHGTQMGTAFDGSFAKFTPVIYFDADHLDDSKVTVDIDILSVDAKDSDRNKNLLGSDFFDSTQFPTARFETNKITKTGDNTYSADATLTIRGTVQQVTLPFTLDISKITKGKDSGKDKAVMTGKITLDRSKFQIGQGDWADPSVIANEVPVDIKVSAISDAVAAASAPQKEGKAEENKNDMLATPPSGAATQNP